MEVIERPGIHKLTQATRALLVLVKAAPRGISAEELRDEVAIPQYNWVICEDLRKRKGHVIVSWKGKNSPDDPREYWRFYYCGHLEDGWLYPPEAYPVEVAGRGARMFEELAALKLAQNKKPCGPEPRFTMAKDQEG